MEPPDYEFEILQRGEQGKLPFMVDNETIAPISVFRELVDAKLLTGDPMKCSGVIDGYEDVAITLAGRRRLAEIREARLSRTARARLKRFLSRIGWAAFGAIGTLAMQYVSKLLGL